MLRAEAKPLAALITDEMGKPITQAIQEVLKSAQTLDWYAEHGPAMLADEQTLAGPGVRVTYEPLGPVLSIQPWNFPIWQTMRGAVTILLGGNSYVLKPAPTTVGCAHALADLWSKAGLPAGAFTVLNAEPELVGAALRSDAVAAVTLTGSVGAGAAVAAQAGAEIKKAVLELGGSDPFLVLSDADLDAAVEGAVAGRFQNSGQVCIAAKRIIVEATVADEFTRRFTARVQQLVVGDPHDPNTFVGPLARRDLRTEVHRQVEETLSQGARLLAGGHPLEGPGFYYAPTVLAGVAPGMTAFDQEIFGPVAALVTAADRDEAVALANRSEFGLSASVWTSDPAVARQVADALEVGGVFVNRIPVSDPRIPIGGVKKSGFGRELSHFGVHEFMNAKTLWLE
jgi:succinate-semialdehyde dehydrogenase